MIYTHKIEQKPNEKDLSIYQQMIKTHRSYIQQQISKRQELDKIQIQKHNKAITQNMKDIQKQFFNTIYNKSNKRCSKLSKNELQDIPAKQFMDLCLKISQIKSSPYENNKNTEYSLAKNRKISLSRHKMRKSQPKQQSIRNKQNKSQNKKQLFFHKNETKEQKLNQLQANIYKLIPKLSRLGVVSNKQFLQIFRSKLKQVKQIQQIKQQIQLEQEYQICFKHEQTAKILISSFRKHQKQTYKQTNLIFLQIQSFLKISQLQNISKGQQFQFLSWGGLKAKFNSNRIQAFKNIVKHINQFNEQIKQDYTNLDVQQISIKDLKSFIKVYKQFLQTFSISVNQQLNKVYQPFFAISQIKFQNNDEAPSQLQKSQNFPYLKLYEQFTFYQQYILYIFSHLKRVLQMKDTQSYPTRTNNHIEALNSTQCSKKKIIRITS